MIGVNIRVEDQQLECISSIQYLMKFKKDYTEVQALVNSSTKINAMTLAYTAKLELHVYPTDNGTQKIDRSILLTYGIVLANFQMKNKYEKTHFVQKTLLVAHTTIELVQEMLFLALNKMKINFVDREFN